mmetsp:Transcript_35122/g.110994  ORF Transcript_35122/g.110994 Transcript_35122/m.110994 type:complete len:225 (-) Transcript_35122:79-753(-)
MPACTRGGRVFASARASGGNYDELGAGLRGGDGRLGVGLHGDLLEALGAVPVLAAHGHLLLGGRGRGGLVDLEGSHEGRQLAHGHLAGRGRELGRGAHEAGGAKGNMAGARGGLGGLRLGDGAHRLGEGELSDGRHLNNDATRSGGATTHEPTLSFDGCEICPPSQSSCERRRRTPPISRPRRNTCPPCPGPPPSATPRPESRRCRSGGSRRTPRPPRPGSAPS